MGFLDNYFEAQLVDDAGRHAVALCKLVLWQAILQIVANILAIVAIAISTAGVGGYWSFWWSFLILFLGWYGARYRNRSALLVYIIVVGISLCLFCYAVIAFGVSIAALVAITSTLDDSTSGVPTSPETKEATKEAQDQIYLFAAIFGTSLVFMCINAAFNLKGIILASKLRTELTRLHHGHGGVYHNGVLGGSAPPPPTAGVSPAYGAASPAPPPVYSEATPIMTGAATPAGGPVTASSVV